MLAILRTVNAGVNQLPYKADIPGFDDWSPIDESGGDCDSYAVAKLRRLYAAGIPIESLRLACCYVETGEYHAVLIADLPEGAYMLDNRQPFPVPIKDVVSLLGYKPDRIQKVGGQREWVEWVGAV